MARATAPEPLITCEKLATVISWRPTAGGSLLERLIDSFRPIFHHTSGSGGGGTCGVTAGSA